MNIAVETPLQTPTAQLAAWVDNLGELRALIGSLGQAWRASRPT